MDNANEALRRINVNIDMLNTLLNKLSEENLDFNDDVVISLLIMLYQNLSSLIIDVDQVHNVSGKMVGNYRIECDKINASRLKI